MSRCGGWLLSLGLAAIVGATGCQTSGHSEDGSSGAPMFGVNYVPRQSEPEIEDTEPGPVAKSDESVKEPAESDDSAESGTLLSRFIPGREKPDAERKVLPVNERTAAASDDDLDF